MRKVAILLLIIFMSGNLTACWSNREVNDIAIVSAIGLDMAENGKIRLSLQFAIPLLMGSGSSQGGAGTSKLADTAGWVVSEDGATVMETFRNIQQKLPRKIFFSHSRVIVIGNSMAKSGVVRVLDFFERYRESQMKSYLVVSATTASDILNYLPKFERLPSEAIFEELKRHVLPTTRLVDFLNALQSEGVEPYAPVMEIIASERGDGKYKNLVLSGTAVFKNDRMAGRLNDDESRGLLWVTDSVKEGIMTIELEEAERKGRISAELEKVHVSRTIRKGEEGKLEASLHAKVSANIYENTSNMDLETSENTNFVINALKKDIEERIGNSSRKVQKELRSDIFGYGQSVYRRHPQDWKKTYRDQWDSLFSEMATEVDVDVRVLRTGLTNKTIKTSEVGRE
ncbi:Ger(x)C family spore germination protein [Fontibacillus sp. BL9]|uniref:Ger(x)C family spore germination protein n=1 Tax=Fontibacillus sp. BL9 TaxID=3389971 RepID=UPI00397B4DB6